MKRSDIVSTINQLSGESGHKTVVKVYNEQNRLPRDYRLQDKDPWCAATVTAVFLMNGYNGFAECSCPVMIAKAKQLGIWEENDAYVPELGDVIMYDWQDNGSGNNVGVADHVGIVIGCDGKNIVVREGNKNNSIGNRTIKVNGKYIRGYILPPYSDEEEEITVPTVNPSPKNESSQNEANSGYVVERVYTVHVGSALNVRKGPGTNYGLVGYRNLTSDAKRHANAFGALLDGTRVTCKEVRFVGNSVWMKIPSGWICAISGKSVYVK